jgi:TPR repeat protein
MADDASHDEEATTLHPAALGKTCALCDADFSGAKQRLTRCGGCRTTHYCSREHQAAHWDAHARDCAAEVARREVQEHSGGLVLGAEAAAARAEEKAAAAAAAEAAADRKRIEALDVAALRLELDRRGALAGLPKGASREALIAARLAAPAPTPETLAAAADREERASLLRMCRVCSAAIAEEPAGAGRCSGCCRVRYCGSNCHQADWPRHKPECRAWKAEAVAVVVAAGGCPLGDLGAQEAAIKKWAALESLAEIRKAAEGGDFAAQFVYGDCFDDGAKGAPQDAAEAVRWLRRSAAGNVAKALLNLGLMHDQGQGGLSVDHAGAARLYALAAAQGLAGAEFNLGCCYRDGEGVPRDLAEAARLFCLSAEKGTAEAQADLSVAYMNGYGIERDYAAAMLWARRSADQGNAVGERIVGVLHHQGRGVPLDLRNAVLWYSRSAKQGDEDAKQNLFGLAAKGVPEATTAVRRLRLVP